MLSSVARTEKRLTIARWILNHVTDFSLIALALGKVAPHQGEAALFELLPPGGTCRLVRADQAARVGREQQRQEYLYLIGNMENL